MTAADIAAALALADAADARARAATPELHPDLPADRARWSAWVLACGCHNVVEHCDQCDARRRIVARARTDERDLIAYAVAAREDVPALAAAVRALAAEVERGADAPI